VSESVIDVIERKPFSDNKLVDWLFIEVANAIDNVVKKIYLIKTLKDPDDRRKRLYGYLCKGHEETYITHRPPHATATQNLLHEVLHVINPRSTERRIRVLESILWRSLTDNQKRYLRRKIPKFATKKEPGAT
jgi:hypothetical protein